LFSEAEKRYQQSKAIKDSHKRFLSISLGVELALNSPYASPWAALREAKLLKGIALLDTTTLLRAIRP
jgi:hypothetical protein